MAGNGVRVEFFGEVCERIRPHRRKIHSDPISLTPFPDGARRGLPRLPDGAHRPRPACGHCATARRPLPGAKRVNARHEKTSTLPHAGRPGRRSLMPWQGLLVRWDGPMIRARAAGGEARCLVTRPQKAKSPGERTEASCRPGTPSPFVGSVSVFVARQTNPSGLEKGHPPHTRRQSWPRSPASAGCSSRARETALRWRRGTRPIWDWRWMASAGLTRTYDLLQRLDDVVREACKEV